MTSPRTSLPSLRRASQGRIASSLHQRPWGARDPRHPLRRLQAVRVRLRGVPPHRASRPLAVRAGALDLCAGQTGNRCGVKWRGRCAGPVGGRAPIPREPPRARPTARQPLLNPDPRTAVRLRVSCGDCAPAHRSARTRLFSFQVDGHWTLHATPGCTAATGGRQDVRHPRCATIPGEQSTGAGAHALPRGPRQRDNVLGTSTHHRM